jgi:hypothetical protein
VDRSLTEKLEQRMETNRRILLGAGLTGAGILLSRSASAQEFDLPSVEQTVRLLGSHESVGLLYARFSLAEAIATDLVTRISGVTPENPGAADGMPLLPYDRIIEGENNPYLPFQMILDLAFSEGGKKRTTVRREFVQNSLLEKGDPLSEGQVTAISMMLERMAVTMQELATFSEGGPIADALQSCVHVERIAAAIQDTNSESAFLCRFFPFSYFCSQ